MENRRFRLHFSERDILTVSQRKQGLNRSWLLLKPNLKTIADLAHYLTRLFQIHHSCPHGILLYIDGFVLPEFESVEIVSDKDLICVKRKRKFVDVGIMGDFLEVEGMVERRNLGVDDRLLLANEEFENGIGGYESEEEEERTVETIPVLESKKRKAVRKSKSPKKKRKHTEKVVKPVVEEGEIDTLFLKECKVEGCKLTAKKVGNGQRLECTTPTNVSFVKRGTRHTNTQEKEECGQDTSQPGDRTKGSSRSARRKKAKRRWLREKLKLENELKQKEPVEKAHQQSVEKDCQESSEDSSEESSAESSDEAVMRDEGPVISKDQPVNDEENDDEVTPVEIRPGHIRFEPRSKDHDVSETQNHVETFQWNGITSKKKGQKWGTEKDPNRSWNDNNHRDARRMTSSTDVTAERCALDFEKLESYVGLPKKGDVMAYRLMELSASWCPEVSSFRVGKVASYDRACNVVRLETVPEYPFSIEKRQERDEEEEEEEDCAPELDPSPYDIDGSLEVEFSVIVDPRVVKRASVESSEVDKTKTKKVAEEKNAQLIDGPSHINNKTSTPTPVNGAAATATANTWDEVIQVLSAKKLELSANENGDEKKQKSGKGSWSYRAMRGSALGPIMARLREHNELEGK